MLGPWVPSFRTTRPDCSFGYSAWLLFSTWMGGDTQLGRLGRAALIGWAYRLLSYDTGLLGGNTRLDYSAWIPSYSAWLIGYSTAAWLGYYSTGLLNWAYSAWAHGILGCRQSVPRRYGGQ